MNGVVQGRRLIIIAEVDICSMLEHQLHGFRVLHISCLEQSRISILRLCIDVRAFCNQKSACREIVCYPQRRYALIVRCIDVSTPFNQQFSDGQRVVRGNDDMMNREFAFVITCQGVCAMIEQQLNGFQMTVFNRCHQRRLVLIRALFDARSGIQQRLDHRSIFDFPIGLTVFIRCERCFEKGRHTIGCNNSCAPTILRNTGTQIVLRSGLTLAVPMEDCPNLLPETEVFLWHIVNVGVCPVCQQQAYSFSIVGFDRAK